MKYWTNQAKNWKIKKADRKKSETGCDSDMIPCSSVAAMSDCGSSSPNGSLHKNGTGHNPSRKQLRILSVLLGALAAVCLSMVIGIFVLRFRQARFVSRLADSVLRFHVIANSDTPEDQAIKLQVRDALISYMARHADTFHSAEEAANYAAAHLDELEEAANAVLLSNGIPYTASASLGSSQFPEKQYGDLTFPPGTYQALRIELGAAEGQNWWCVLYPLLCYTKEGLVSVPEESEQILQDSLSPEDYAALTGSAAEQSPVIRIRLVEWIRELLGY